MRKRQSATVKKGKEPLAPTCRQSSTPTIHNLGHLYERSSFSCFGNPTCTVTCTCICSKIRNNRVHHMLRLLQKRTSRLLSRRLLVSIFTAKRQFLPMNVYKCLCCFLQNK
jgi:hypothetical protein